MASYVMVWENNTIGHRAVSGLTWSGHAALNIGEDFDVDGKRGKNGYVSWWPAESADFSGLGILKAVFSRSQAGRREVFFQADVRTEGYLPDHVIRLATTAEQERTMLADWKSVYLKPSGEKYRSFRKNCSTIVSRILHAAGFHSHKWAVDCNFAWSPGDVRKLATDAGGRLMTWTEVLKVLARSGITPDNVGADFARSGRLCSTGAPCKYQSSDRWKGG